MAMPGSKGTKQHHDPCAQPHEYKEPCHDSLEPQHGGQKHNMGQTTYDSIAQMMSEHPQSESSQQPDEHMHSLIDAADWAEASDPTSMFETHIDHVLEDPVPDLDTTQREVWIQSGGVNYNYWRGHWWMVTRFDWDDRGYWMPAYRKKVPFSSMAERLE